MRIKSLVFMALSFTLLGCGKDDEPSVTDEGLTVPPVEFDLDQDRLLSSLSDEEISTACEEMARVMAVGDEGIACRILAVGENDSAGDCTEAHDACLEDPEAALSATTIRTTPAPIDCSIFSAALTEDCEHTVQALQDCADGLANSVVPSADAVTCSEPDAYSTVDDAEDAAKDAIDAGYVAICAPLLECEALVGALLTGMAPDDGLGGSSNNQ